MIILELLGFVVSCCLWLLCEMTWLVFAFNIAKNLVKTFWFNPVLFVLGLVAATFVVLVIWLYFAYLLRRKVDLDER